MSRERLAYSDAASSSALVDAMCRDMAARGVSFDIHADDEMLHFFLYTLGYPFEQAVTTYLTSGREIWKTLRQIMAWRFGTAAACGRVLDFASGYGRVTRHIVAEVPREAIWVADVYAEGVAFQERAFGVNGIVSTREPEDLAAATGFTEFDCILVSSLFTHLPAARFAGWLRRLGAALSPGGMLLFSVHDLALAPERPLAAPGFAFVPSSESGSLPPEEYGTAWMSEETVRAVVRSALGDRVVHRFPRGLASYQDLYVVLGGGATGTGAAGAALAGAAAGSGAGSGSIDLAAPRWVRGIDGFVEHCSRRGRRGLVLSGWVADRVTGLPAREVRVRIDGAVVGTCRTLEPRDRLAFPTDPILASGWNVTLELVARPADDAVIAITVVAGDGEEIELHADSLLGCLLCSAQVDLFLLRSRLGQEAARPKGA